MNNSKTYKIALVFLSIILMLSLSVNLSAETQEGKLPTSYEPSVGLELAEILDRPLILVLVSQYCGHCQHYKDQTLSDPEIKSLIEYHFIFSMLEISSGFDFEIPGLGEFSSFNDLSFQLGYRGTPHTSFIVNMENSWNNVANIVGFRDKEYLKKSLRFVGAEKYKKDLDINYYDPEENDLIDVNFEKPVKVINRDQLSFLMERWGRIEKLNQKKKKKNWQGVEEIIISLDDEEQEKDYAHNLISNNLVQKVFIVK